jgi:phosphatidylglycerophosphate synthase
MNFREYKELVHAPKKAQMAGDMLYRLERNISVRISWILFRHFSFITPNHVTMMSFASLFIIFGLNFIDFKQYFVEVILIQLVLLYFITILDKIDGELARSKSLVTQKGLYYDYTVHFFYPFIVYFTIGHYFFSLSGGFILFYLTMLLSVITMALIEFKATRNLIGEIITTQNLQLKDWLVKKNKRKANWPFPVRLLHYLTFMLYSWILFYYFIVILIGVYDFKLAYTLYAVHIVYCLIIVGYKVFWQNPHKRLFRKPE